jgi:hypothetical protein
VRTGAQYGARMCSIHESIRLEQEAADAPHALVDGLDRELVGAAAAHADREPGTTHDDLLLAAVEVPRDA